MDCGDACPVYIGRRDVDLQLDDPAGKSPYGVRVIRDQIDGLVRGLLSEL
jgi:hypothetical protein